jgi:FkbM family methyltransferase
LIGRHIYLSGEFDRTTAEILINFAEPGDVLLDIGANIGYMSACFLQNVPASRVVAVEPQPAISELCRQNLAQFNDRALVVQEALSDVNDHLPFIVNPANSGGGRLADRSSGEGTIRVPVRAADDFFRLQNFAKLDVIKIDVEWHESKIIASALPFLRELQPRVIIYEDVGGEQTRDEIGRNLKKIGYSIFGVKKRLTRVELRSQFLDTNDFVAVPSRRPIPKSAMRAFRLS